MTVVVGALHLIPRRSRSTDLLCRSKISAGVAGIRYAIAGVWLRYELPRRIYPTAAAFWSTLTRWLGGPLLYYYEATDSSQHRPSVSAARLNTTIAS